MAKVVVQNLTRNNKLVVNQSKTNNAKVLVQNKKRELPKIPSFSSTGLIEQIRVFTQPNQYNYYLGFGGMGDALLLLASCWDDPKARVIFFANQQPFIRNFFELFGMSLYLHDNIMGTAIAGHIYDIVTKLPNFKQSAHLVDGLNYGDWINENKYMTRIRHYVPWGINIGKIQSNKPVVIIGPSGSSKDVKRQRFLHHHEYRQLVNRYLDKGYSVYGTGSVSDLHMYGLIQKENSYWLTSDKIYSYKGEINSDLRGMLKIINSAEIVISMDTWLKTYTLLCGIPTTVIETRWSNSYRPYGEDVTDWIFLNPKIWEHIQMEKIEKLLAPK